MKILFHPGKRIQIQSLIALQSASDKLLVPVSGSVKHPSMIVEFVTKKKQHQQQKHYYKKEKKDITSEKCRPPPLSGWPEMKQDAFTETPVPQTNCLGAVAVASTLN